jgi:hypothetical protein
MRQAYHHTGYGAFDLTECKIHRVVDKETGKVSFLLCCPKAWEAVGEKDTTAINGKTMIRHYNVTEWEEIELEGIVEGRNFSAMELRQKEGDK